MIRYAIIIGFLILLIVLIIVIIIVAKSDDSDNTNTERNKEDNNNKEEDIPTYLNVIKAKYFTEKENEKIKIINYNNDNYDKLNIKLFVNNEEKTFNNEYTFIEPKDYLMEFKYNE
jgi:hypothetical protein